jgi:hypothetical protein
MAASLGILVIRSSLVDWRLMKKSADMRGTGSVSVMNHFGSTTIIITNIGVKNNIINFFLDKINFFENA